MTGYYSKRDAAADKLQEDLLNYGTAWSQDGKRIDPMSVYKEPVTEREALKLALEALEAMQMYAAAERKGLRICDEAIASIKEALAQPAQREWVGLTDDEHETLWVAIRATGYLTKGQVDEVMEVVEAKLKERNHGT